MRIFKTIITATTVAAFATASVAGGLSDQIMEAPVAIEEEMMAAPAPSIDPTWIVLGIFGLLVLSASASGDDEPEKEGRLDDQCGEFACVAIVDLVDE